MAAEIYDVVLQSTGAFQANHEAWEVSPPPVGNLALCKDMWVGHLPHDLDYDAVYEACSPRGYNFNPIRQFGCRYALCRRVDEEVARDGYFTWDNYNLFRHILFLSRLIHPTTVAVRNAARIIFEPDGNVTIAPAETGNHEYGVFVSNKDDYRDWLCVAECEKLRTVWPLYKKTQPDRIAQARRHMFAFFHAYYLDQRIAFLVMAYESLLKIERHNVTKQFSIRVSSLSKLIGVELTQIEAEAVYDDRSTFVHGKKNMIMHNKVDIYERFELVLRETILRACTDSNFSSMFSSDDEIKEKFGTV